MHYINIWIHTIIIETGADAKSTDTDVKSNGGY